MYLALLQFPFTHTSFCLLIIWNKFETLYYTVQGQSDIKKRQVLMFILCNTILVKLKEVIIDICCTKLHTDLLTTHSIQLDF